MNTPATDKQYNFLYTLVENSFNASSELSIGRAFLAAVCKDIGESGGIWKLMNLELNINLTSKSASELINLFRKTSESHTDGETLIQHLVRNPEALNLFGTHTKAIWNYMFVEQACKGLEPKEAGEKLYWYCLSNGLRI